MRLPTKELLQRLSPRERRILFATLLTLASALLYQFPFQALERSVLAARSEIAAAEKLIADLSVQFAELKVREADVKAAAKSGLKGWQLVDQKGVILLLRDVSAEARRQGISLVSVHPTREVDKENYREVSLNMDLKGRYRELARYFQHIEKQSRLVNIRKIRVEACPDSSSACATQIEAVAYMAK